MGVKDMANILVVAWRCQASTLNGYLTDLTPTNVDPALRLQYNQPFIAMAKSYTIVVTPVAELRNSKCPYKNANIGSKFGGQLSWWKGKDLVREHAFKPGEDVKETLANLFAHVIGTRAPVWVFLKLNSLCEIVKVYRSCDMDTIKLCSTSSSTVRILLDFEKVDNRERSFVELNDVDESLGHDSGIFTDEGESFGEILPLKRYVI